MSITAHPSANGRILNIKVAARFDFNVHSRMRAVYTQGGHRYDSYVIDLADTVYMDSSALGMLLQLKEHAGGAKSSVRIRNAQPGIREILAVANFTQLMTIE